MVADYNFDMSHGPHTPAKEAVTQQHQAGPHHVTRMMPCPCVVGVRGEHKLAFYTDSHITNHCKYVFFRQRANDQIFYTFLCFVVVLCLFEYMFDLCVCIRVVSYLLYRLWFSETSK